MDKINYKRTLIFILSTIVLCLCSFSVRDFLISKYNGADFILFKIDYIKNYGAAFSILHTHTDFLILLSLLILFIVLFYIFSNLTKFSKFDFFLSSLLCSGIICNLVERLSDGFVTDYIRLNFITFPIFNVSDMFICIGAFIIICNILFSDDPNS